MLEAIKPQGRGAVAGSGRLERRVAGALGAVVIAMLSIIGVTVTLSTMADQHKEFAEKARTITQLLADQSAGGVQFKRAAGIETIVQPVTGGEMNELATYIAYDLDGAAIVEIKDVRLAGVDAAAAWKRGQTALAGGGGYEETTDTHLILVRPVLAGKERRMVGSIAAAWSFEQVDRDVAAAVRAQILLSGASALIIIIGLLVALRLTLTRPLASAMAAMRDIAAGNLTREVAGTARKDELGDMARTLAVFRDSLRDAERLRAEQEAMKASAEGEKRVALARLADEFERSMADVVRGVDTSARRMRETAQGMHAVADRSSQRSSAVARSAERAAGSIDTVAAAAEELSASIQEISARVAESARIAGAAVAEAERSNATVAGLVEAASRIGEVVKLISDIASQTNLLALNATIEAARAGEAGKGFAVVASEVKNLAAQTAKATEEIGQQIADIQGVAGSAADAIRGVGGTIGKISEIVTTIATAVEEQGAATGEIARSVAEVADNTKAVSATIGEVSQAGAETGGMAGDVLSSAEKLVGESEALRAQVAGFVQRVRAG